MTTNTSEPFVISRPPQEYAIPQLKGVQGRYVRIRPSISGDGYLSISQIQVIDAIGDNVALNAKVTATSSGGSPIDQKYGKLVDYGGVYQYQPGVSADPSVVTDGVLVPRNGLTTIFETAIQNTPANDTQYLEIDLSGERIISKIIYTGRGDPQRESYTTYYGQDNIDQITRLTDMRLEIRDSNRNLVYGGDPANPIRFSDTTTNHVTEIPINMAGFIVNKGSGSAGTPPPIQIPDIISYKAISDLFTKTGDPPNANINLIRSVNTVYNSVATPYSSNSVQYVFDISGGLFQITSSDNPVGFYHYIYSIAGCPGSEEYCSRANNNTPTPAIPQTVKTYTKNGQATVDLSTYRLTIPTLSPTVPITIFGTTSPALEAARAEMNQSIELCKSIFLGSPQFIENYISIEYPSGVITNTNGMKVNIRNTDSNYWCMPDIIQVFSNGSFVTQVATRNQDWNKGTGTSSPPAKCTRELTTTLLALLPYATRNFIIEWIRGRQMRYLTYYNSVNPSRQLPLVVPRITLPSLGIDLTSATFLDSLAQQFYELLGGQYSMSYIYDVLPLGTTMLDVRFNLIIHTDSNTTYGPIADLKAQYRAFLNSGVTLPQNTVEQANTDYEARMSTLEQQGITNTTKPFQGAVARLFYTKDTTGLITITGMIFDSRAVTSFIKELNCGLTVPLGPMNGNVNYTPDVTYTLNEPREPLVCTDPNTIRNIMNDYTEMAQVDKNILLTASSPIDTSRGTLFVQKVTGVKQVSPLQCAIDWTENVYDPVTNKPIGSDINRRGLFSYYINREDWFAQNLVFAGTDGFKLYPTTGNLPDCVFNPATYAASVGNRLFGAPTATVNTDFLNNAFKNGAGAICQGAIPMYTIPSSDTTNIAAVRTALTNNTAQPVVKTGASSTPQPITPIIYTKPLPTESTLDTASGTCPAASCADLDVLYGLAYQYNANPSMAGMILNIQRAYTAGPNQCDIEAQVNYDATITDILPASTQVMDPVTGNMVDYYPSIKKGTVTYSQPTSGPMKGKTVGGSKAMPLSGIQTTTIALYVDIDKTDCSYTLADASGANSGFTIQANTPYLYKPLNYAMELQARTSQKIGSSVAQIQSDFSAAAGSTKQALQNYRVNTYSAIGSINTLTCNKTCSSMGPNILINYVNSAGTHYKIRNITAMTVLNVGTFNSNTCDLTFGDNSVPPKKYGARITLDSACNQGISLIPINPIPTYTDIQNVAQPLTTAAVSGFTDFVSPPTDDAYPLKTRGFGLDRARNADSIKEIQFTMPLKQEIPIKEEGNEKQSHRFIRFVPLKTRDPDAYSVAIGRLTFFYEGQPLALEGRATNPMGTWEGDIAAVTGPRATGWIDRHKKPLVFSFKSPIMVDAYSLTTDTGLVAADPIAWKLESSTNGTYWTLLNSQPRFSTPIGRGKETEMIYIG